MDMVPTYDVRSTASSMVEARLMRRTQQQLGNQYAECENFPDWGMLIEGLDAFRFFFKL